MHRRRTNLDHVVESERPRFLSALVSRFAQALSEQFPQASGYQHTVDWWPAPCVSPKNNSAFVRETCRMASLRISRGRFWGLHLRVIPQDISLRTLKITIEAYFPAIERPVAWVERFFNLPGQALWVHFLMPILILLAMALLPLMALYQLAKLWLREDVLAATRQLEFIWPEIESFSPGAVALTRRISPSFTFFFAFAVGIAASARCFWLTGLVSTSDTWRIILQVAGSILGLISFGVLIALIMTMLGHEVDL